MSKWERIARYCEEEYGTHIDWEDRFFICPECSEPIYECDWDEDELLACPVCEFCW
jgi:hypothetical protein